MRYIISNLTVLAIATSISSFAYLDIYRFKVTGRSILLPWEDLIVGVVCIFFTIGAISAIARLGEK